MRSSWRPAGHPAERAALQAAADALTIKPGETAREAVERAAPVVDGQAAALREKIAEQWVTQRPGGWPDNMPAAEFKEAMRAGQRPPLEFLRRNRWWLAGEEFARLVPPFKTNVRVYQSGDFYGVNITGEWAKMLDPREAAYLQEAAVIAAGQTVIPGVFKFPNGQTLDVPVAMYGAGAPSPNVEPAHYDQRAEEHRYALLGHCLAETALESPEVAAFYAQRPTATIFSEDDSSGDDEYYERQGHKVRIPSFRPVHVGKVDASAKGFSMHYSRRHGWSGFFSTP